MKTKMFVLLLLVVASTSAQVHETFEPLLTEYGVRPYWANTQFVYKLNDQTLPCDDATSCPTVGQIEAAIQQSFAAWQAIEPLGSTFKFSYGGRTSTRHAYDGENVIVFSQDGDEIGGGLWGGTGWRAKADVFWEDGHDGLILECDILVNNFDDDAPHYHTQYKWTVGYYNHGELYYDIQSVITHEIGHWIGLTHSPGTYWGSNHSDITTIPTMIDGNKADQHLEGCNPGCAVASPYLELRTLSQDDINGAAYVWNLYAITGSVSGTISQNTVWGNVSVTGTVAISQGVTLAIVPGSVVSFASGASIICNGTLYAKGTSSSGITLTSSSGSWDGIVINTGGSASIQYCNIFNATTGVHFNGVSSSQTVKYCNISSNSNYGIQVSNSGSYKDISYNTISGQSYCIYLNNGSAAIDHNTLTPSYSGTGIYSYGGGSWWITNNDITAFTAVYSNYYSTLYLLKTAPPTSGYNEAVVGSVSLLAENNSTIEAGGYWGIWGNNSFYGGGIDPQMVAQNYSHITALRNYWREDPHNNYPDGTSTIDFEPTLGGFDPNQGGFGYAAAPVMAESLSGSDEQGISFASQFFDAELNKARQRMAEGNYEEAIRLFAQKYKTDASLVRQRYALARIAECYKMTEKEGFVDFLNSDVRPSLAMNDDLYLESLELEAISLTSNQKYEEAASVFERIRTEYVTNKEANKHALFNLANLYHNQLNDEEKARGYVEELKADYAGDHLTGHARMLLGEESVEIADGSAEEQTETPLVTLDNYPNPSNPSTTIRFSLPSEGRVSLKVYDVLGRVVADLINETMRAGQHQAVFNGSSLPSGVYFYRLEFGGQSLSKKFVLAK